MPEELRGHASGNGHGSNWSSLKRTCKFREQWPAAPRPNAMSLRSSYPRSVLGRSLFVATALVFVRDAGASFEDDHDWRDLRQPWAWIDEVPAVDQFAPLQWRPTHPLGLFARHEVVRGMSFESHAEIVPAFGAIAPDFFDGGTLPESGMRSGGLAAWQASTALVIQLGSGWRAMIGGGWQAGDTGVGAALDGFTAFEASAAATVDGIDGEGVVWLRFSASF